MRKKDQIALLAQRSGLFGLSRVLLPATRRQFIVLAYHRVLPVVDPENYPFDIELISASPEDFRWQMQFVAEKYSPVSIGQVAQSIAHGTRLPERAVLVTFDDGFADNYEYAFPILRAAQVPACFFVSTDVVGTDNIFWFDYVAHLLLRVPVGTIALGATEQRVPLAPDVASRRAAIDTTQRWLKGRSDAERCEFVSYLESKFGGYADAAARHLSRTLTWDQIREMSNAGMDFGSHGATHGLLAKLAPAQFDHEIAGSKSRLEREIGKPVVAISYPVGGPAAFTDEVIGAVRTAGYQVGFTYMIGANPAVGFDPFRLRRQHVERTTSRAYFEGLLSWPQLFK